MQAGAVSGLGGEGSRIRVASIPIAVLALPVELVSMVWFDWGRGIGCGPYRFERLVLGEVILLLLVG